MPKFDFSRLERFDSDAARYGHLAADEYSSRPKLALHYIRLFSEHITQSILRDSGASDWEGLKPVDQIERLRDYLETTVVEQIHNLRWYGNKGSHVNSDPRSHDPEFAKEAVVEAVEVANSISAKYVASDNSLVPLAIIAIVVLFVGVFGVKVEQANKSVQAAHGLSSTPQPITFDAAAKNIGIEREGTAPNPHVFPSFHTYVGAIRITDRNGTSVGSIQLQMSANYSTGRVFTSNTWGTFEAILEGSMTGSNTFVGRMRRSDNGLYVDDGVTIVFSDDMRSAEFSTQSQTQYATADLELDR